MTPHDIATTLRKVSALRSLCLRLPHVPTPAEKRLLERFEALTAAPTRATAADMEAIAVGWSGWWRGGNTGEVLDMAARIPVDLIEASQTASSIWAGALRARWEPIQHLVWLCAACVGRNLVETKLRQQTPPLQVRPKLLVVSIAPPFEVTAVKKPARSATNDPDDKLRRFLERVLGLAWTELTARGLALVHAVKCGIVPEDGHQNPPNGVVDECAPRHLMWELLLARPLVVVTLGRASYRAVVQALRAAGGSNFDGQLRLTRPPAAAHQSGYVVSLPDQQFRLFAGPFIRASLGPDAAALIRAAASAAGL